jgi:hypothetical protein
MRDKSRRGSIYDASIYLFYILKALGLAHYDFDKKTFKFNTSTYNVVTFYANLIYWIYSVSFHFVIYFIERRGFESGINHKIIDKLWQYQYLFQMACSIPIFIVNFTRRQSVWNLMESLHSFDSTVEKLQWKHRVVHSPRKYLLILSSVFFFFIYYMILTAINLNEIMGKFSISFQIISYFSMVVPFIHNFLMYIIISTLFVMSCFCITARFNALHSNIRSK